MRIVFIGTVEFSYSALEKLIVLGAEVKGVVSKNRSPVNADFANLIPLCKRHEIPFYLTQNINGSEELVWIRSLRPDVIFCFGWSSLLKSEILNIPPMGVIGFHPAELPRNRGRHPLIWALALGLEKTASTFFFMDEEADSGDILSQEQIRICYEDDARTLYDKMRRTALGQIEDFFPRLLRGNYLPIPQDHSKANYWRKRGREDGWVDFRMSRRSIYNLVRALTRPYVGAHIKYRNLEVKVWKVKEVEKAPRNIEPGKVLSVNGSEFTVKCADGAVRVLAHDLEVLPEAGEYLS